MDTNEIRFKEEAYCITGAAMEVYNLLGFGFLESVYAAALGEEFGYRGIPFEREVPMEVTYKGKALGKTFRADFVAYGKILIELKALERIGDIEIAQVLNYLKASGLTLGLIFNFGNSSKMEWARLVN
jgi:GxxExxY protein